MAQLRTYRFLSVLVGLALFAGIAAPAVQMACAMMPGAMQGPMQEGDMPCPDHKTAAPVPLTEPATSHAPCCGDVATLHRPCCRLEQATLPSALSLSEAAPRLDAPCTTGLRSYKPARLAVQQPASRGLSAVLYLTLPTRRQALLATFLI